MSSTPWTPNWQHNWDPEVGLWWEEGPGHTVAVRDCQVVHPGRESSLRLVQAALVGQLDQIEVERVLGALRQMQVTAPGKHQGCFRWYWEEPEPIDTNAAFFTTINLLALHLCFREALEETSLALLDAMLTDVRVWFAHAVAERTFYYPNKYLGDLVCAWLLHEEFGQPEEGEALAHTMLEAADYWRSNGWGWGEHMSDTYSWVCLHELSLLLLFAKRLPAEVRETYRGLLGELLAIEDAFDGGVRVPAIRSYAFAKSPHHVNYRDRVRPWNGTGPLADRGPALENLFAEHGWHDLAPPRAPARRSVTVPCFGGAVAVAHNESDCRLGSVSHYPVMPMAEHDTWGLCWQSFPVCFWRPGGDWGFLQWEVEAEGRVGAHPCSGRFFTSYGNAPLALGVQPPIVGCTWAIQRDGNLVALRILPAIDSRWERACDRLRVVQPQAQVSESREGTWRQLVLTYPERQVSIQAVPFAGEVEMILRQPQGGPLDWELCYAAPELQRRRALVTLWGISLDGPVTAPPVLEPDSEAPVVPRDAEEKAWRVRWLWPRIEWHLRVDPLAAEPLRWAEE